MSFSTLFPANGWGYGVYGENEIPYRAKEETVSLKGTEYLKYRIEFLVDGAFKKANTSLASFLKDSKPLSEEEFKKLTQRS